LEIGQTFAEFAVSFSKFTCHTGQVFSEEHYSDSADDHNFHHAHTTEEESEWSEMCQRTIYMV